MEFSEYAMKTVETMDLCYFRAILLKLIFGGDVVGV